MLLAQKDLELTKMKDAGLIPWLGCHGTSLGRPAGADHADQSKTSVRLNERQDWHIIRLATYITYILFLRFKIWSKNTKCPPGVKAATLPVTSAHLRFYSRTSNTIRHRAMTFRCSSLGTGDAVCFAQFPNGSKWLNHTEMCFLFVPRVGAKHMHVDC